MIAPLRGEPSYEAMREELERRIEALRRNVEVAEQTGDWTPLLDKIRTRSSRDPRWRNGGDDGETPHVPGLVYSPVTCAAKPAPASV